MVVDTSNWHVEHLGDSNGWDIVYPMTPEEVTKLDPGESPWHVPASGFSSRAEAEQYIRDYNTREAQNERIGSWARCRKAQEELPDDSF